MLRSEGEETTDYLWGGAGELAEVWNKGEVYTYEYDHTGLRTAKTVDGVTTSMITDGMYVVAEYVGANSTYYYRGMNLIGYVSDAEIGYYRFNAHGDVVAVVDTAGEIITEYSYDPFGKLEDDGNEWLKMLFGIYIEDRNPFRYCAEYFDTETEFIYLRARYYSPDLQRFISEDPIRDGNNWYAYCRNNALMFSDPLGWSVSEEDEYNLPDDALEQLEQYTDDYIEAEKELNYIGMNEVHKAATKLRQQYYVYEDTYDYTHGGKYDLYTNGCSSYEEGGHPETVFYFDQESFERFHDKAVLFYKDETEHNATVLSDIASVCSYVLGQIKKNAKLTTIGAVASGLNLGMEILIHDAERTENKTVNNFRVYAENLSEEKVDNIGYYVYLLDGGTSTEILIKETNYKKSRGK